MRFLISFYDGFLSEIPSRSKNIIVSPPLEMRNKQKQAVDIWGGIGM